MTDRTLTVEEVAQRYAVGPKTVRQWIDAGELRAVNCGRRLGSRKPRFRVTPEALAAFELLRMPTPPPPQTRRRRRDLTTIDRY